MNLDKIEKLARASTAGPLDIRDEGPQVPVVYQRRSDIRVAAFAHGGLSKDICRARRDASFFVTARETVLQLVAEIRRLKDTAGAIDHMARENRRLRDELKATHSALEAMTNTAQFLRRRIEWFKVSGAARARELAELRAAHDARLAQLDVLEDELRLANDALGQKR